MQIERMREEEDGRRRIRELRQCWQLTREIELALGLQARARDWAPSG